MKKSLSKYVRKLTLKYIYIYIYIYIYVKFQVLKTRNSLNYSYRISSHRAVNTPSLHNFHSRTVHLDIIRVFVLPTDAQENSFEKSIKIYIKTAPKCFGLIIIIIRERIIRAC